MAFAVATVSFTRSAAPSACKPMVVATLGAAKLKVVPLSGEMMAQGMMPRVVVPAAPLCPVAPGAEVKMTLLPLLAGAAVPRFTPWNKTVPLPPRPRPELDNTVPPVADAPLSTTNEPPGLIVKVEREGPKGAPCRDASSAKSGYGSIGTAKSNRPPRRTRRT